MFSSENGDPERRGCFRIPFFLFSMKKTDRKNSWKNFKLDDFEGTRELVQGNEISRHDKMKLERQKLK